MNDRDRATSAATSEAAGPRQEYIDAFDDTRYGRTPGEESGRAATSGGRRATGRRAARRGGGSGGGTGGGGRGAGGPGRRAGWGRSLTGVAAAAVVTVLALVTVGQLTDPDEDVPDSGAADAAGADELTGPTQPDGSGEAGGVGPADPEGREPGGGDGRTSEPEPTFDELMETTVPLDPDLTGSGELVPVAGSDPAADPDAATVVRYRVDVEEGLGIDPEFFADAVHRILSDERGWGNDGERSFARVAAGTYDFVVTLASPGTTADWCDRSGLDIREDNVSCNSSSTERVMINAWRWAQGSETYGDDIRGYREMLINHEVGHRIGYPHALCPSEGALAPVMMQQTKFLTTDGITCVANPWPHPDAGDGEGDDAGEDGS
ncbi:DUF3152 domain-containing protein [Streptomyces sp. 4N509B]|uniref:DUF3152 domain-containing protein n=1 Tax=Streptomyces sp. 4N509B TaxID=3457413 RepID=UPI003FD2A4ED